jgi:hypothetical protein
MAKLGLGDFQRPDREAYVTYKLIEHVDGTGILSGPGLNVTVQYGVTVRRRYIYSGLGDAIPGRRSVSAQAVFDDADRRALHDAYDARLEVVLTLADGRTLPCYIQDMPIVGDNLTLVARGNFPERQASQ